MCISTYSILFLEQLYNSLRHSYFHLTRNLRLRGNNFSLLQNSEWLGFGLTYNSKIHVILPDHTVSRSQPTCCRERNFCHEKEREKMEWGLP